MKFFLVLILVFSTRLIFATEFEVNPADAVIVIPDKSNAVERFAAQELQYHLQLITGTRIPVCTTPSAKKYTFYIGKPAPSATTKPKLEEGRWSLTPEAAYLWGGDILVTSFKDDFNNAVNSTSGTLYAVYDFLYKILHVRHIEPGNNGISYHPQKKLKLPVEDGSWYSTLEFRGIRGGLAGWQPILTGKDKKNPILTDFALSSDEYNKWKTNVRLWRKRMRMGARKSINYGHAFTHWWEYYHKAHPEYFAVNLQGRRVLQNNLPSWAQLCLSNPAVVEQVFQNWLLHKGKTVNLCLNDGVYYCKCKECRKLGSISDQLVWFSNKVMEKVSKIRPDAYCTFYAYLATIQAPKKYKINSRAIVGFVPNFLNLKRAENNYKEWHYMGARAIFLRPNTFHINIGLPMGYEKEVFKEFQLGVKYNVIGTDVDSLQNFWSANGIAPYILARAFTDSTKSFEHWENEYCSAYGNAKEKVKKYFQYIRKNVWEKRVISEKKASDHFGYLRQNIIPNLKSLVYEEDYIKAGRFLAEALKVELTAQERRRLNTLILENQHALLTIRVVHAKNVDRMKYSKKLLNFRLRHKNELNILWPMLIYLEQANDITGIKAAAQFKDYSFARITPEKWYFEMDEKSAGEKAKWFAMPFDEIKYTWSLVPTTVHWENFSASMNIPSQLVNKLKDYNGVGWYAQQIKIDTVLKGKEIFLYFGAVDENCKLYVNGKFAGEHQFLHPDDWKTPFAIRIDKFINWNNPKITAIVRVIDNSGCGGIWKPVWLVAK